jgi:hypothetical protein
VPVGRGAGSSRDDVGSLARSARPLGPVGQRHPSRLRRSGQDGQSKSGSARSTTRAMFETTLTRPTTVATTLSHSVVPR